MSPTFPESDGPEPADARPILPEQLTLEDWMRVDWLDLLDGRGDASDASIQGAGEASDARSGAVLQRARLHLRALASLSRPTAPAELDGAVVAALHAGHREGRAVRILEDTLGRVARQVAPEALEARVRAAIGLGAEAGPASNPRPGGSAPPALDRLVERAIEAQQSREAAGSGAPSARPPHGATGDRRVVIVRRAASRMAGASLALVVFAGILVFGLRRADAPTGSVDEGSVGQGSATAQPSSGVAGPSQQRSSGTSFVKIVPVKVDDLDPAERAILESFGGPLFGGPS